MSQNQRAHLFGSSTLSAFRERQLKDLEARANATMAQHAQTYGATGAPTAASELHETFKTIEAFATQQIDKMQRMGISGEVIRETVLSSIQGASMGLPRNTDVSQMFDALKERVNNSLENQLQNRMDIRRSSLSLT